MDISESPIIKKLHKPRKCQNCGGVVLPILYGFPTHAAFEMAEAWKLILGGCCIPEDTDEIADWVCKECGQRYKKELPLPMEE